MTTVTDTSKITSAPVAKPPLSDLEEEPKGRVEKILVGLFVAVPMVALVAAIPLAWGWGLGWHDVVITIAFYLISGLGISMGFHRYFTHGSFKANTGLRVALAIASTSLAIEGTCSSLRVADHRWRSMAQRQGRRPALAMAVRRRLEGTEQGPGLGAHRLDVRRQSHVAGEVLPGPAGR